MIAWFIVHWDQDGVPLYWCGCRGLGNLWSVRKCDAIQFRREEDATKCARSLPAPSGQARPREVE